MASDFRNVRRELQENAAEQDSGNVFFVMMLIAVIAIGGAAGYWLWPRADGAAPMAQVETTTPVKISKSELKKARRAEMTKFRETQAKLLSCAGKQRHMMSVYQQYNQRNLQTYKAWFQVLDPSTSLSKMGEMNALEANAYMLTQGNGAVRDMMQDIHMELSSGQASISPIECGQLNADVQRRKLDLTPVPTP
ncbi:MAG: hypothetical protein AAFR51_00490 [Pseudomonadota bacterium]